MFENVKRDITGNKLQHLKANQRLTHTACGNERFCD